MRVCMMNGEGAGGVCLAGLLEWQATTAAERSAVASASCRPRQPEPTPTRCAFLHPLYTAESARPLKPPNCRPGCPTCCHNPHQHALGLGDLCRHQTPIKRTQKPHHAPLFSSAWFLSKFPSFRTSACSHLLAGPQRRAHGLKDLALPLAVCTHKTLELLK